MTKSISIPKETRHNDRRVVLFPDDLNIFVDEGFSVNVESGAGEGQGISDQDYAKVGANIATKEEIWTQAKFIPKLLCPTESEVSLIAPGTHISAFFYPGEHYKFIQAMMQKSVTAYSYEYFQHSDGTFPMMRPDGWLSGRMAMLNALFYLQTDFGGRGQTLGSPEGITRGNVVVIGHGNVGDSAIKTALSLGGNVTVVGHTPTNLEDYARKNPDVNCILADDPKFDNAIREADIVIGAILISTYDSPAILTEQHVKSMKSGSVIVDVTCGYGTNGYMPTADKVTMPGIGPYSRHGVLHLKNPRLPALVPLSAATSASKHYAPYLLNLAKMIADENLIDPVSQNGKIIESGEIVHHHVISDFAKIESDEFENYEISNHLA